MKHFDHKLFSLAVPLCLLLVAGCASTARGQKQSIYQAQESIQLKDSGQSSADASVIIRYPAIIDRDAEVEFFDAFVAHPIGGSMKEPDSNSDRVAEAIVAKSNYFAMSLFRELKALLPENSVLLSPHIILKDENGRLTSEPLLATENVPSVLTIDFGIYSFPDTSKLMDAPPLTFGDLITPLFVVHSNRWLMPTTHGLLLASQPLMGTAWSQSALQADEQFNSRLAMQPIEFQRSLDFIRFLEAGPPAPVDIPMKAAGSSREGVYAVEDYPLEKIHMDSIVVENLGLDGTIDPFAKDFVKGAATRVMQALNEVDHDRASFFSRQTALGSYDPELAQVFMMRSADESVRARLRLAESLLVAERKFLARQSDALYDGSYSGSYGQEMRQMISAEYRLLEDRRELARQQNISTALAIVAMAGAVYAGSQAGDAGDWGSYSKWDFLTEALAISSIWAVNEAMNKNAESKMVGENFLMQMAPALSQQSSVQIELLESNEEITAGNFAEFRSQTASLYQNYARSMTTQTAATCDFVNPAANEPGAWYGACDGGLANGQGYGLIRNSDGSSMEYLGGAVAGLPQGLGAMIKRSKNITGAIYYEGQFLEGLPDGIVRVEQPGRKAVTRKFRAGKDVGAAEEKQLSRMRFQ